MEQLLKSRSVEEVGKAFLSAHKSNNQTVFPGRSLIWKLCFLVHPQDSRETNGTEENCWDQLGKKLCQHRHKYDKLYNTFSEVDGLEPPHPEILLQGDSSTEELDTDVPVACLNFNSFNGTSWQTSSKKSTVLENSINVDSIRLPPLDLALPVSRAISRIVRRVLYIWCSAHEDTGYHQGLHEIVQKLAFVVVADASNASEFQSDEFSQLQELASLTYIEADTYTLFESLMRELRPIYCPMQEAYSGRDLGINSANFHSSHFDPCMKGEVWVEEEVEEDSDNGEAVTRGGTVDLTTICHKIQDVDLAYLAPDLHAHLMKEQVEPLLYGLKWLKLLFIREFRLGQLLKLWDELFCGRVGIFCTPSETPKRQWGRISLLEALEWISVTILVSMSSTLKSLVNPQCLATLADLQADSVGTACHIFVKALELRNDVAFEESLSYGMLGKCSVPFFSRYLSLNPEDRVSVEKTIEESDEFVEVDYEDADYGREKEHASSTELNPDESVASSGAAATWRAEASNEYKRERVDTGSSDPGKIEFVKTYRGSTFIPRESSPKPGDTDGSLAAKLNTLKRMLHEGGLSSSKRKQINNLIDDCIKSQEAGH
eukprot:gb/GECG01015536.1/.p1 GENE.gb/GECG01015536.1/~~gb/GECG01015536.1/.p1  ORF type:complete len:601 (+),score=87.25 gb/GECG01015536.1/:1-1803(+)